MDCNRNDGWEGSSRVSTLSFVDEPSENLDHIVTGGAIGIILGVGIVGFMQATKSQEIYEQSMGSRSSVSTGGII